MVLPAAEDLIWARQRRATVRAAGGILDLVLPLRVGILGDTPHPGILGDTPHPGILGDTPHPGTLGDTPHPGTLGDTPHPGTLGDTPHPGGSGHPLFCAPPVVGLSWCYLALLPHVGAEHPIYGLQSRGLRRPEPERRGHEVGLLAILDARPTLPASMSEADDDAWFLYNFVLGEFGYEPALRAGEPEPEARTLALIRGRPGLGLDEWPDRRVLALLRVIRNNVATARGHRPGRVRCPVLFVAATRSAPSTEEKLAAWRRHADGPIDAIEVDCRHDHMLLPKPIARIAAVVTGRLGSSERSLFGTAPPI